MTVTISLPTSVPVSSCRQAFAALSCSCAMLYCRQVPRRQCHTAPVTRPRLLPCSPPNLTAGAGLDTNIGMFHTSPRSNANFAENLTEQPGEDDLSGSGRDRMNTAVFSNIAH